MLHSLLTHASTGGPPTLAGSFGSVSCRVTVPLLWGLVHAKFCVCPPRLEFLLAPVFWKSYNQIPLALPDTFPKLQVPRLDPQAGKPGGLECSQQGKNFLGIIILQSVGHPPSRYRIWSYCDWTLLPSCCGFLSLDMGYLLISSIPLNSNQGLKQYKQACTMWISQPNSKEII